MRKLRVGFLVSGRGRLFLSLLCRAEELGIEVAFLLLDEKADGCLEEEAGNYSFPCQRVVCDDREKFDRSILEFSQQNTPDIIVLAFDKLLSKDFVAQFPNKILNIHMSLLPAYRGFGAVRKALRDGVKVAGATIHIVTDGMDDGPIVAQCCVGVLDTDSEDTLGARIYSSLEPLLRQVMLWYRDDRIMVNDKGAVHIKDQLTPALFWSPPLEGTHS
jgi:phosphoribosylglycinamide formyltransferase-1